MKRSLIRTSGMALAALTLGTAAQAQHVIVRNMDEAQAAPLRAAIAASMAAAARGERVGMITGTANPRPAALRGGGVAQELDASTLMYSVARINGAGEVEKVCVNSIEAAEKAVQAPSFAQRINLSSREITHASK